MLARDGIADCDGLMAPKILPHAPRHPEKQQTTDKQKARDTEQLDGDAGKHNAQNKRKDDALHDGAPLLLTRQTGSGQTDGNRIIAGQCKID